MITLDSNKKLNSEEITWRLEKSNFIHSDYNEDFDNPDMRFIFKNAFNADIPVHTTKAHYDKKFLVKAPPNQESMRTKKRLHQERWQTQDEVWLRMNTTTMGELVSDFKQEDGQPDVKGVEIKSDFQRMNYI
jgi:phenylpropionate dioxygenase-like ring-hydroxylating dioxygenase large terminal subunit